MPSRFSAEDETPEISVVIPLHNEQENLAELHRRLSETFAASGDAYEILFVDDGSSDTTPRRLVDLAHSDPNTAALFLSRNFGQQAAVSAGLEYAQGRAVVIMDGDLQDPPELIPALVELWREGNDVVYAIRRRRREPRLKRIGYAVFYRLLRSASDLDIPLDSGDFSLMDRRVVESLNALPERRRFVRGLRSFVGFRQVGLPYDRPARGAGTSKYPLRALLGLAIDGLVSFSGYPLRIVTCLGVAAAGLAACLLGWVFIDAFSHHTAPRGWASTIAIVLFMGSIQLISLGIIGEYIRLIFLEAKGRPSFIVSDYLPSRDAMGAGDRLRKSRRASVRGPHTARRGRLLPRSTAG